MSRPPAASNATFTVPQGVRSPYAPALPLHTTPEWHLARRVAQAPSFRLVGEIRQAGVNVWLSHQLSPGSIPDPEWDAMRAKHYPWLDRSYSDIAKAFGGKPFLAGPTLGQAMVHRSVLTRRVLQESVCDVMADLVHVPWRSKAAGFVVGYDRDVIRAHALGRYADLLLAAVTHPALLCYLDNVSNVAREPNENLGREILELYTVGRAGYTEEDVRESSRILTGLGVDETTGTYVFDGAQHAAGLVRVAGFAHANPALRGRSTTVPPVVRAYVEHLAHQPGTARRLAQRLCVRFVSDNPSPALVDRLTQVYLANDTRLVPVLSALFADSEFWASVGQKWARPREVIGRARRSGASCSYTPPAPMQVNAWDMGAVASWYETAGDMPGDASSADGYPDDHVSWSGSSAFLATCNATAAVAWHWDPRAGAPAWREVFGLRPGMRVWDIARQVSLALTGYTWRDQDLAWVASLLGSSLARPALAGDTVTDSSLTWDLPEAVHLVLSSPYSFLR